ncbi:MAG: hypothetical protein RR314_03660 [Oscillospiraceae bacterium]
MNFSKILLSVFAVAALLLANVRLVYSVRAEGEALPGTYTRAQLCRAESFAIAAAEELSLSDEAPAKLDTRARVSFSPADGDTEALAAAYLESAPGIGVAWEVEVGGKSAGIVSDPSALGEVLEVMLADGAAREAVTVDFTEDITMHRVFVPEGRGDDMMEVARLIRGMTEVMSVTGDGTVRYG